MIYDPATNTLIEMVTGAGTTEERMAELAALKGRTTKDGKPIAQVALIFLHMSQAEELMPAFRRLGLECRAFTEQGVEKVLFTGSILAVAKGPITKGPLLPILREEAWPHLDTIVHRRLLANVQSGPWLTFGWDTPREIVRVPPHEGTVATLEPEALANLAKRPFELKEMSSGTVAVYEEYGSEAFLVPSVMAEVARRVRSNLVAVAVPKQGGFFAASASAMRQVTVLMAWARKTFDEAQGRRISPLVLLVQKNAQVLGFGMPETTETSADSTVEGALDDTARTRKSPWWKFW